ncbi:MAG: hypothetical protein Kow00129_05640 [Thermoleophilia bacterium]
MERSSNSAQLPREGSGARLAETTPPARNTAAWLIGCFLGADILLLLLHGVHASFPHKSETAFLDLDSELSLGSWFSSAQYLAAGLLILLTAADPYREQVVRRRLSIVLGAGLMFLSMDEGALFHERLGKAIAEWRWLGFVPGGENGWAVVYATAALVVALVLHRDLTTMLRRLPAPSAMMITGFFLIFGGAVLLDSSGGSGPETIKLGHEITYELRVTGEEGLELIGGSLLVLSAFCFAGSCRPDLSPFRSGDPTFRNRDTGSLKD